MPGGTIAGNTFVWRQITFSPITTTGIRVLVNGSLNGYSRIVELEAYAQGTAPGPGPDPGTALIGFPSDNWWNLDISNAPVYTNFSRVYRIHRVDTGAASRFWRPLRVMPYIVAGDATPKVAVQFGYSSESDGVDQRQASVFRFIQYQIRRSLSPT